MLIPLLLLAGGGFVMHQQKKEEEKLLRIAQEHRARAAELNSRLQECDDAYRRCSKKLAEYNPQLDPAWLDPAWALAGDDLPDIVEGGENWRNI